MIGSTMIRIEFPPALFTRELAAYYLSMSVREIDDLRSTREITAVGTGKRVKFRKADLDRIADRLPERDASSSR